MKSRMAFFGLGLLVCVCNFSNAQTTIPDQIDAILARSTVVANTWIGYLIQSADAFDDPLSAEPDHRTGARFQYENIHIFHGIWAAGNERFFLKRGFTGMERLPAEC